MIRAMLIAVAMLNPSVAVAQGLFDWMGKKPAKSATVDAAGVGAMQLELLALRPQGKHAYIVAVCSESDLASWSNRAEVESKGWGVSRMEPRIDRATSFVVIGDRVTALRNLPTNEDLNKIVQKIPKFKSLSKPAMEITMFTRPPCPWCDKWMAEEAPKAIAAGAIVLPPVTASSTRSVPYFQVCGADGYCREYSGFTTFESMKNGN